MTHERSQVPGEPLADSAGIPWQGRSFDQHSHAFADDVGDIPAPLAAALEAFRAGTGTHSAVLEAFEQSRLLIPLIAVAGEEGHTPEGRRVEKTQELSIVTVHAPDGRSVLPVFSSVAAMQRWNAEARPVPNFGRAVAQAAVEEGSDLVILDPTSPDTEFVLRRPALWAIAQGVGYQTPWSDPQVAEAFDASVAALAEVTSVSLENGDPTARLMSPELRVALALRPGLSQDQLSALLTHLQTVWAQSDIIADRVDSMSVKLLPASKLPS